jgi:cobyrinic acid a,c-diamide synthase
MTTRRLIIAGTHSGVGKTTIALGLMAALRGRGLTVQPFKVGPDFIDPGHHTAICGRVCRNLDTWILSEITVRDYFSRAVSGADVAIIEGVMGLFDGRSPDDPRGSTADVARLLSAPVILVVDASAVAGSIAAVVKGFSEFSPEVRVVGVICNRVAGQRHYEYLEPSIRRFTKVIPLGWLPRRPEWEIPERHLGLMTAEDLGATSARWENLSKEIEKTINLEQLLGLASSEMPATDAERQNGPERLPKSSSLGKSERVAIRPSRCRVAVAQDAAFCFYYPENLELLEESGGEIVPFSPLVDDVLPDGTGLLYLGGGYPELHARKLADNASMRGSIQHFHREGGTIYAECGGLMYACRELVDVSGNAHPMLDLLPARTVMQPRLAKLGYVTLQTTRQTPLGPNGTEARGHEFHYSRLEPLEPLTYAADLEHGNERRADGLASGNLLAGYAHLHFGSNPQIASSLLKHAKL